jgi:pantetheine-phosphate adenylyltransferase
MVKAIYAGTFDPITNGHMDIIHRSMQFCDQLVIAIGINPSKKTMFSEEERIQQINKAVEKGIDFLTGTNIQVITFQGLLVEYAKQNGANILVRGIRSVSDFEYEINLANINKVLAPSIETVFLPTSPELAVVSSSMVKEVCKLGGDITKFVPAHIVEQINSRFGFTKHGDPEK